MCVYMYVHMFSSGVKPERLRGPSLLLLFNFPSWIKVNRCWSGSMNRSAAFIFKHITALHRFHYLDQGPRWLSIVLVWRSLSWINNSLHRGSLFHLVTAASSRNWAEHSLLSEFFPFSVSVRGHFSWRLFRGQRSAPFKSQMLLFSSVSKCWQMKTDSEMWGDLKAQTDRQIRQRQRTRRWRLETLPPCFWTGLADVEGDPFTERQAGGGVGVGWTRTE